MRELSHKGGFCYVGWAMYAPWACYAAIWTLYNPKPTKCELTCLGDLAADRVYFLFIFLQLVVIVTSLVYVCAKCQGQAVQWTS